MNVLLFIRPDGTVRWAWTSQSTIDPVTADNVIQPGEVVLLLEVLDSRARHNHEVNPEGPTS